MSTFKSIVGTIAMIFAIQPVMAWATETKSDNAKKDEKTSDGAKAYRVDEKKKVFIFLDKDEAIRREAHPPICAGGA